MLREPVATLDAGIAAETGHERLALRVSLAGQAWWLSSSWSRERGVVGPLLGKFQRFQLDLNARSALYARSKASTRLLSVEPSSRAVVDHSWEFGLPCIAQMLLS
jgi:hypothetical protein